MDSSVPSHQTTGKWSSPITPAIRRRVLDAYRANLPDVEYKALTAWLSTFYPFQQEWILDPSRFAVCLKSRQIGMSHSTAAAVVAWAAFLGETTTLISIGQREADEVFDKSLKHARALEMLGSQWARATKKGEQLRFVSGGRILAVPSSSGGRGFSGSVFVDEFAYLEKPDAIWDAAAAVTLHAGRFRVASTPNGVGNAFYDFWTHPKKCKGWTKHEFPLARAVAEGMKVDVDDCWKMAKGDPRIFDQQFNCKFLDGNQQLIPTALISDAATEDIYCHSGETFAGLDIGRVNDRTSLRIIKRDADGVMWNIHGESLSRTSSDDIDRLASVALNDFRCSRLCVDSTGMGAFPAADLQKRYGRFKVEPVTFTMQSKEDMATTMYQAFAERAMRIPRDDEQLRTDLCAIRRIVTSAGNIRYDAPQTDDGHGDDAWALALAIYASARPDKRRREID